MYVKVNNIDIPCKNGEKLYDVLLRGGISFNAPCGGNGTCGQCNVWIDKVGKRKSCEYFIENDTNVSIDVPKSVIATKGMLRNVLVTNYRPCVAVDIGTTTVVAYLIDNGNIIDVESAMNEQKPYGDDVVTRIKYTCENNDGLEKLNNIIKNQVEKMVNSLSKRNKTEVDSIAIVANTTMLHIYANVSPESIGVAPFTPEFLEIRRIGKDILLPSISGYVGSDMVAAILSSGMHLSEKKCLLIDIGTNGEIALGSKDGIYTCATAAGPAFEGAHISCGVGGVSGAINTIEINETVAYTTIDNIKPIGICGSAILDGVSQMLKAGIIDETGAFASGDKYNITDGISITQKDIREVQLAKAAIAAGVKTLLIETDTSLEDIEICYIAGGFGSYLNKESACNIGLISKEILHKIESIGNAAGMGAVLWQISDECINQVDEIIEKTLYIELSASNVFNENFIDCMMFE